MDHTDSGSASATLIATRRQLHGIAECLLAGPEHRQTGEIALRITPGGFSTTAGPEIRLDGLELVHGERRVPVAGSFRELAGRLGVEFGAPASLYSGGSGVQPDDVVDLDPAAARLVVDWYALSDAGLRILDPDQQPTLWPEHFDVAILLDDRSYGSSPGDDSHSTPYAYISEDDHDDNPFWNVPFGALRDAAEFSSTDDLVAFWRKGRALLQGG
ncbi:MAG TPA: hypothetical protein VI074_07525 [Propionibacteriaceae bacterium]